MVNWFAAELSRKRSLYELAGVISAFRTTYTVSVRVINFVSVLVPFAAELVLSCVVHEKRRIITAKEFIIFMLMELQKICLKNSGETLILQEIYLERFMK